MKYIQLFRLGVYLLTEGRNTPIGKPLLSFLTTHSARALVNV